MYARSRGIPSTNLPTLTSLTYSEPATVMSNKAPNVAVFVRLAPLISCRARSNVTTAPMTAPVGPAVSVVLAVNARLFGISTRHLVGFDHADDGVVILLGDFLNAHALSIGQLPPDLGI